MSVDAITPGIGIVRCTQCGAGFYPARLMCPRCGSDTLAPDRVYEAVVEETTVVRYGTGQENFTPKHLATVRTAENQVIVVGTEGAVPTGERLALFERGVAPIGRLTSV